MRVEIDVNGKTVAAEVEARLLLVQFIRDVAGLKGTNIGCDTTSCGACTVLLDGQSVKSCTVLAAQADGTSVTTIEGLAPEAGEGSGEEAAALMHPVQRAFHENHGLQCGYCTPGMVMAVTSLIAEAAPGELDEVAIREGLEGNLCRCTGYHNIVAAAMAAAREAGVARVAGVAGAREGASA
ncbi:MAG: (2Fe-2S)-binding protein [Acidimicrobiales bacterium]